MPDPELPLISLEGFRPLWPPPVPCLHPLPAALSSWPLAPSIVSQQLFGLAQVLPRVRLSAEGLVYFMSFVLQQQQMPRSSQEEKDEKEKEKEKEGEKEEDKQETENDKEELTK